MIDIITGHQAFRRMANIEEMHRLRYRVFKERLGWEVKTSGDRELDEYDTEKAIYFLGYDENERLSGTWRLLPTTGPYMLKDTFPSLLEGRAAPANAVIWETSRFAVERCSESPGYDVANATNLNLITFELFLGLVEYCVEVGIEQIYTVYDLRIARILPRIGCKPFWQSRPAKIGVTTALAGAFVTSSEVLQNIRRSSGIEHSVIRLAPWNLASASRRAA
jgi:acyl homoserine lactone synthase